MAAVQRHGPVMRLWTERLACRRGGRDVFADLTLSVPRGEALSIRGRNGAGKSSLLRLLAGLLQPAAGRIGLEGGAQDASLTEQAHYVGHQDAVKSALTVSENLDFWTRYLGGLPETAPAALERLGLAQLADLPAAYLSAGQRRRLSLSRLLTVKRPVWLLDEPATALDAGAQITVTVLMREHLAAGGIIVAAIHSPLGLEPMRDLVIGTAP